MQVDYFGLIAPAGLGTFALVRAANGWQPKGALAVATLMFVAVLLLLSHAQISAMLVEVVAVGLGVVLIIADQRWANRQRSVPFNLPLFLGKLGCLAVIAAVLGVGINAESPALRLASWFAVAVVCVGLRYLGHGRDGDAKRKP